MTKKVRIENADTGTNYIPVVQVCASDGTVLREFLLISPTCMLEEYIHSEQYIKIVERDERHS